MLSFWPSDAVILVVQAALVAVPGPRAPAVLRRLSGSVWGWLLPASLLGTIVLISELPGAADGFTWLAFVGCPIGTAIAVAGWMRSREAALVAGPLAAALLLAGAWAARGSLGGQTCALVLTALSAVTLAAWLAALAPARIIEAGIVVTAILDSYLVFSKRLEHPNAVLNAAVPLAGLPRLQVVEFGSAVLGYGDLLAAAAFGAALAARGALFRGARGRGSAALITFVCAGLFDLLFLVRDELPATVPVAVALLVHRFAPWPRAPERLRLAANSPWVRSPVDARRR